MQVKAKGNTDTEEEDDEETTSEDDIKEAKKTAKKLKEAAAKEEAEQKEIEKESLKVVNKAKAAAKAKRQAEIDAEYGEDEKIEEWWKEVAAEERDRKKKGQKINRFDGSYHLDDDEPKGKRDFADGGSISGVNNYAKISKKPISKKSKRHNHADSEDNSDSFKSSESHKKHQHKHHSKAQNEQDKSTDTKVNQDPKLIKALNKKVNALKKSGQLSFKTGKQNSQADKEEPKKSGSYLHFVSDD